MTCFDFLKRFNLIWLVFVTNKPIKIRIKNAAHYRNGFFLFPGIGSIATDTEKKLIARLKRNKIKGNLYKITDGQFKYRQVIFKDGIFENDINFKKYLILTDKDSTLMIPVTTRQINGAKYID